MVRFSSDGVAYAAGLEGYCQEGALMWASHDHGQTWEKLVADGLPHSANVMALRVQPGAKEHLFAISAPERFSGKETCGNERWPDDVPLMAYESLDGGTHFSAIQLPVSMPIEDVKFDVARPSLVWATVHPSTDNVEDNGAVYRRDGNGEFKLVSDQQSGQIWPLAKGGIRLLDLRRQRPWHNTPFSKSDSAGFFQWDEATMRFVHVTSPADYQKWDMGWSGILHAPQASLNGHLQSFVAMNDDEAWWLDDQFVHKISAGGKTVMNVTSLRLSDGSFATRHIDNAVGAVLVPSPVDANILYTGYFDMGCWRTASALAKQVGWRDCNGEHAILQNDGKFANSILNGDWHGFGGNVVAVAPDPQDAKVVFAVHAPHNAERGSAQAGYYKVLRSSDGFSTFTDLTYNLTALTQADAIVAISVEARANTRRLWVVARGRLYKLEDGAKLWTQVLVKTCDGGILVMAQQGQTFMVGGTSGFCVSHDGGATWAASKTSARIGLARSTWWGAFDATPYGVSDFAFDPKNPRRIYMTVMMPSTDKDQPLAGLYVSNDAGENWAQIESFGADGNKQRNFARSVAVNPEDSTMIVVGTSVASVAGGSLPEVPMGAFISRDGGKTWANENTGLVWPFITKLRFAGSRLYALSPGQGVVFSGASP